jgi:hypothetical protein
MAYNSKMEPGPGVRAVAREMWGFLGRAVTGHCVVSEGQAFVRQIKANLTCEIGKRLIHGLAGITWW